MLSRGFRQNTIIIITHYYSPVVSHVTERSYSERKEKNVEISFNKMEQSALFIYENTSTGSFEWRNWTASCKTMEFLVLIPDRTPLAS